MVLPGAFFSIINGDAVTLNGRTLENAGTLLCSGGEIFMIGIDAVITNDAGADFVFENPGVISFGGGAPRYDNAGTFWTADNGTTGIAVLPFNNYGSVKIEGGAFTLMGGGFMGGSMIVPSGATSAFTEGTFTSSSNLSITGGGVLEVSGGAATLGARQVHKSMGNSAWCRPAHRR